MNMDFHRLHAIELQTARRFSRPSAADVRARRAASGRSSLLSYAIWPALACAAIYLIATTSPTVLWLVGAAVVATVAIGAAVCIYLQNNTPV